MTEAPGLHEYLRILRSAGFLFPIDQTFTSKLLASQIGDDHELVPLQIVMYDDALGGQPVPARRSLLTALVSSFCLPGGVFPREYYERWSIAGSENRRRQVVKVLTQMVAGLKSRTPSLRSRIDAAQMDVKWLGSARLRRKEG